MAAQNPLLSDISKAFLAVPELHNNGTNFELWKAHVKAATRTIGSKAILTTLHTDANFDGIVAAAIQGKLQNNLFMLVNTLTTCKGIMDSLITRFGQTTAVVTADAERQLFSMKCQSDSHIMKHLDDLELQYNHVTGLGRKIEEATYINIIIASLPSSYRPTIDALSTSIDTQNRIGAALRPNYVPVVLTSTQVISSVRAESLSRNLRTGKTSDHSRSHHLNSSSSEKKHTTSAAMIDNKPQRGNFRGFRGRGCGFRGRGGSSAGTSRSPTSTNTSSMTCYNCNGKGHLSAKCPSPRRPRPTAHAAAATTTANTDKTTSSKPNSTPTADANATISFDNSVWSAMADTKFHAEDGRMYTLDICGDFWLE